MAMTKNKWELITAVLLTALVLVAVAYPAFASSKPSARINTVPDMDQDIVLTDQLLLSSF